jgi:LysR family transcriptional regulator, glycine cleavage system transcriptional activator
MRRLPPLNALQIFETVARHRSFTRAADHLCLTQGAVSRQILTLEEYYGFPLFTRHSKGLALTNEGEQLLPTVKESFSRIEEISLRLTRQRTDLALKVPTCLMRWILPKIMRFQAEYPEIQNMPFPFASRRENGLSWWPSIYLSEYNEAGEIE